MKAMILAAGFGTRLRPLTNKTPKPLIEIAGRPLIEHQIRWLKNSGFQHIVINVHHLAEKVISYLGSGARLGVRITFSRERELLNTGGGIVRALPYLGSDPFMLLNGDIWSDYPFARLKQLQVPHAHLLLTSVRNGPKQDFSLKQEKVQRFDDSTAHDLTYCGIAVLNPNIFRQCRVEPFSLTSDLLFDLVREQKVTGEVITENWIDIGTRSNLAIARKLALPVRVLESELI